MKRICSFLSTVCVALSLQGQTCELLDEGWHFHLGDVPEAAHMDFNTQSW